MNHFGRGALASGFVSLHFGIMWTNPTAPVTVAIVAALFFGLTFFFLVLGKQEDAIQ